MGRVLFFVVVASVLNFGSGMSIPSTLGTPSTMSTPAITYGNSNDPFANWFLSKFYWLYSGTFRLLISCDWPKTVAHSTGMNCRLWDKPTCLYLYWETKYVRSLISISKWTLKTVYSNDFRSKHPRFCHLVWLEQAYHYFIQLINDQPIQERLKIRQMKIIFKSTQDSSLQTISISIKMTLTIFSLHSSNKN